MTSDKTIRRECSALVEAAQELHCNDLYVLTCSEKKTIEWEKYTIHVIPASILSTGTELSAKEHEKR